MEPDHDRAWRTYDEMVRRLAELDRLDGIDLSPPAPRRDGAGRRRWGRTPRTRRHGRGPGSLGTGLVVVVVVGGLLLGTGWWRDLRDAASAASPTVSAAGPGANARSVQWPPLPDDAQDRRLLPVVHSGTVGEYGFQDLRPDGSPVGYDPCRPVHYVINPAGSPPGGISMVRDAVARVSAATGLVFTEDGVTDEPPATDRSPLQEERYGNRWAPVLIAWSTEDAFAALGGDVAGVGGSHMLAPRGPGTERFVSGQVVLDSDTYDDLTRRPDGVAEGRAIVMHELGHVLGLMHVDDALELMHHRNTGQTMWGPGDRQGLAQVGATECSTDT